MPKKTIEAIVKKQLKSYRTEVVMLRVLAGIGAVSILAGIGVYFYSFTIFQGQLPGDFAKMLGILFSLIGLLSIVFALDKLALRKDVYRMARWIEKFKNSQVDSLNMNKGINRLKNFGEKWGKFLSALFVDTLIILVMLVGSRVCCWWFPYVIGYTFAVSGAFLIMPIRNRMHEGIEIKTGQKCKGLTFFRHHGTMIGVLEAFLYTSAVLLHREEFIAVWLVLKVAGRWGRWSKDYQCRDDKGKLVFSVPGRTIYNIFLIGTGLMIAYGVAGGKIIEWAKYGLKWRAGQILIVMVALIAATVIFLVWEYLEQRADEKENMKEH